ncbi:hypothetical protein [Mycobacterium marinum]|uniref:hypothetical protein n=1 Tax=Mycobacterium marinum TaxID=1781 RepID=UPI000B961A96|nr:hypothetical protein [Mycobacterium marinum]
MRENSATVLSTIPLPPGADSSQSWDDWGHKYRVVWTGTTEIADTAVRGSAIQFPDGKIDPGVQEPPLVMVGESQFTTAQARELAAAIVASAELVEGWVQR